MQDTEKKALTGTIDHASELAETAGEEFVIAITAAYLAGLEKGRKETA